MKEHLQDDLSSAEFTLGTLFVLSGLRSQNDRWMQMILKNQIQTPSDNFKIKSFLTIENITTLLSQNLSPMQFEKHFRLPLQLLHKASMQGSKNLIDYCDQWRWRGVPLSVWHSLKNWHSGQYKLVLRFDIPTPQEILEMQIQGQRCVSVFCEADQLKQIHEHHRDAFLFTVHDLEHAWQFNSQPELFHFQMRWAKLLSDAFIQGPWRSFIDKELTDDLNYLISDMNTHPWHALLTLKNLWLQNWKLKLGMEKNQKLSDPDELNFNQSWVELMNFWAMPKLEDLSKSSRVDYFLMQLNSAPRSGLINSQPRQRRITIY
ncbi:MAG: hypothetical protein AABY64_04840 [Bdellovibrionota bacterium]